jgi:hypothetical protein
MAGCHVDVVRDSRSHVFVWLFFERDVSDDKESRTHGM